MYKIKLSKLKVVVAFFMFEFFTFAMPGPGGGGPPGGGGHTGPPCWAPPCVPIDGGIWFLLAAGAVIGIYTISKKKNSNQLDSDKN